MSSQQLSGLLLILDLERPDVVLLQELTMNTEHLSTYISSKQGYKAFANVDELDRRKPGTGLIWRDSLPVTQVAALEPCRILTAYLGPYPVVNIYPPAGTENFQARRIFFRETLFRLMRGLGRLPIIGGDFNCVIEKKDLEEGGDFYKKRSPELSDLVRDFNYSDCFRFLYPEAKEFTWERRGKAASRLDRMYLPQDLVVGVREVSHHSFLSDHKYLRVELKLQEIKGGGGKSKNPDHDSRYWKLNTSVLEYPDFLLEFRMMWERIVQNQGAHEDIAEWWEEEAKPEIKVLTIRMSAMVARGKRELKEYLMVALGLALTEKNWVEVSIIRGRLRDMMREECLGYKIRSRFKENLETEKASLFHVNREKKKSSQGGISCLRIGGAEVTDKEEIEAEVLGYFGALFQGHHRAGGLNAGTPFEPDFSHINEFLEGMGRLSEQSRERLQEEVKMEELVEAVKNLSSNKSPGNDGLNAEFYKKLGNIINSELLRVLNCQLERVELITSDKEGATRLCPKVEGTPMVNQLRPITLLNLDYKILTRILTARLLKVMGEIILSSQSCSVPGRNIIFGPSNILSLIQYIEKYGGKAGIISFDLFKAYDRVYLPFLFRVMEEMNFGRKFLAWIKMLHSGATTRFLLNFVTKPINLLISVRQGDCIAGLLFIIYMEPLLITIRRNVRGTTFIGERHPQSVLARKEECARTKDEAYVDDVNVCFQDEEDLIKVDIIFRKFEAMSGAILCRDIKTKVMGLGLWKDKVDWVLPWVKVVKKMKIFGIEFFPTYNEILQENWKEARRAFNICLSSWKTRSLETIFQKVEAINTFLLPKLYYKALLLPLPGRLAGEFEEDIRRFIWRGKIEKPSYSEMCNETEEGGIGLTCLRSKCDSLLLKQLLRMLEEKDTTQHNHMAFWLGHFPLEKQYEGRKVEIRYAALEYPHAPRVGEEGDDGAPLAQETRLTWHYSKLLEELSYAHRNQYFELFEAEEIRAVTAKQLYQRNTTTFTPPAIIFKRDLPDWSLVWERVGSLMLEPRAREVMYMVINNLYPTQERLFRINRDKPVDKRRVWSDRCQRCNQGVIQDCTHLFMECEKVREGWYWVRGRLGLLLQNFQGLSNYEILHLCFPKELMEKEVMWLMGVWVDLVQEEVVLKGRKLGDQLVRGHFRYKFLTTLTMKIPQLGHINDVTTMDPG